MAAITDTKARNIKPADTAIPHGNITGLALHPSNNKGHGKWVSHGKWCAIHLCDAQAK